MVFTTSQKGFFTLPKYQKLVHEKLRTIESWIVKNCFFRSPNCRKLTHTNLGTLEQCVPRLGWKSIFGPPKCRKWSHKKQGKFESCDPRLGRYSIWRPLNAENELKRRFDPLKRGVHNSAEIAFSGRQKTENEFTQF